MFDDFRGGILQKGTWVISDPLYSHRAIQESGPESGLSRLPL